MREERLRGITEGTSSAPRPTSRVVPREKQVSGDLLQSNSTGGEKTVSATAFEVKEEKERTG